MVRWVQKNSWVTHLQTSMSVFTKLYKQISENIDDGDYDKVISLSDQSNLQNINILISN